MLWLVVGMASTVALYSWDASQEFVCGAGQVTVGLVRAGVTAAVMVLVGLLAVGDPDVLSTQAPPHLAWVRSVVVRLLGVNLALVVRGEVMRVAGTFALAAPLADTVLGAVCLGAVLGSTRALGVRSPKEHASRRGSGGGPWDGMLRVGTQATLLLLDLQCVCAAAVGALCVGTNTDAAAVVVWAMACWFSMWLQTL